MKKQSKSLSPAPQINRRHALGLAGGMVAAGAMAQGCSSAKTLNADRVVSFEHGVASGDPLADQVVLWTRVTPETEGPLAVAYTLAHDPQMRRIVKKGAFLTSAERDYTVKVNVEGLEAGREYFYRFAVGAQESAVGRTKTLPAGSVDQVRFAVVSCSNYPAGFFNAYRALSQMQGIDAILHVGDYIYEYGADGYAADIGLKLGRVVDPKTEIVSLADYRRRYAQYRRDADLQAAHAVAPWITVWDDHETANDSWQGGAQNHNPEKNEGDWSERKHMAVQAYYEWLPIRDPQIGRSPEAIYRAFQFGDLATFLMLETRLVGRSQQLDYGRGLVEIISQMRGTPIAEADLVNAPELQSATQKFLRENVADPSRQMMGPAQEAWVRSALEESVARGTIWQVLGNQVVMARTFMPNFAAALSPEVKAKLAAGSRYIQRLIAFSQLGLPWNLDAWDGYPAARDRLYGILQATKANAIVVTGDTHTAWANELFVDAAKPASENLRIGVEFAGTSVSSPGFGDTITRDMADSGRLWAEKNQEVAWHDPYHRGFLVVTLTKTEARSDFYVVDTVFSTEFKTSLARSFVTTPIDGPGIGALQAL